FGVLALIVLIFSSISPKFIDGPNITNIMRQSVPLLLVGTSVTFLMISGNIDLSVGGILGLSSVIFAILVKAGLGYPMATVLTLLLGSITGIHKRLPGRKAAHSACNRDTGNDESLHRLR
ncbi:MAG TPA: hypothetical protein VN549_06315, partial [Negativicutes bacterium]|nr:hypothetical protein [Negativicutes bacterium]